MSMKIEEYKLFGRPRPYRYAKCNHYAPYRFYTREAVAEILKVTVLNIQGFLNNNLINFVK